MGLFNRRAPRQRLEAQPWQCIAFVVAGAVAGAANAWMSARYGQRLTVDDEGWWTQGTGMLAISAFAFVFALAAGGLLGKRSFMGVVAGLGLFAIAGVFAAFTVSNSAGFTGHQILNKTQAAKDKQQVARDIADIQNKTTLKDREEVRQTLFRTYASAKAKDGRDDALAKIEAIPVPTLQAPAIDVPVVDARATVMGKLFGWEADKSEAMSAVAMPILLVIGEILGPLLGAALWPLKEAPEGHRKDRPPKAPLPASFRQLAVEEARMDILDRIATGTDIGHGDACASRWGVSPEQACKWLAKFRREGHIKRVQNGRRKVVVPAHANGSGTTPIVRTA